MLYNSQVFNYITLYSPLVETAANKLGLSREVVAGAIAEEYNSQLGFITSKTNTYLENHVNEKTHLEILENYNQFLLPDNNSKLLNPDPLDKYNNPVLNDIGNGNIKVFTAISLLNEYTSSHPNDDPLGIKSYNNDYHALVSDINNDSNSATAIFAGLMLQKGEGFFKARLTDTQWNSYDQDYKDALLITYYNFGEEKMKELYQRNLNENNGVYSPKPGVGDAGGLAHLENLAELKNSLGINTPPTYHVLNQDEIEQLQKDAHTISGKEQFLNTSGNEPWSDRVVTSDLGIDWYLVKEGDHLYINPADIDGEVSRFNSMKYASYDPESDNPSITFGSGGKPLLNNIVDTMSNYVSSGIGSVASFLGGYTQESFSGWVSGISSTVSSFFSGITSALGGLFGGTAHAASHIGSIMDLSLNTYDVGSFSKSLSSLGFDNVDLSSNGWSSLGSENSYLDACIARFLGA